MKKLHLRACFLLILATILPTGAFAQLSALENGKVYRFINKTNNNIVMAATGVNEVKGVTRDESSVSQLWYADVTAEYFTLRNLATGTYLLGNGTSSYWGLTADNTATANHFDLSTVDTYNVFQSEAHSGWGYCHYATSQGGKIVGWTTSDASQWSIETIDKTAEEIEQCWSNAAALIPSAEKVTSIQTALDNIFSDKACTTLTGTYSSKTDDELAADANYTALPAALQEMVKKVRDGNWEEENATEGKEGWNSDYAKKFRVQMYEPYSISGEITSFLQMYAHNNLDNPTGIFANEMQNIYIMVEGEIADGAELWVGHINGHGVLDSYNSSSYHELSPGLNIVPYFADGSQLWINYVVHTYNSEGTDDATRFPHKLSDYKPLKIHIEGGHINGYYNAIGDYLAEKTSTENLWGEVDNDADWAYYKERVSLTSSDFTVLAHRQTLQFVFGTVTDDDGNTQNGISYHLDKITVPTTPYNRTGNWSDYTGMGLDPSTAKINIMLEAWDRIMYSEHATLGLISNETMDKMNEMYPRWNVDGTTGDIYTYDEAGKDGKTYKEFCNVDYSELYNHHGVALGALSGFMSAGGSACNYHYNTMSSIIGQIATGNDIWGPAHEIGHQHQNVFNIRGGTEVTNNVFSNAAVWYAGRKTSRYNGNDGPLTTVLAEYYQGKPFIDYNIWAMTQMFYKLWLYYHLCGNNTQFYPRFFEMLRRDPLNAKGETATGSESMLKIYKKMCDASGEDLTEFFRVHGFFVLLDNYAKGDYGTTVFTQTQEEVDEAIAYVKERYGDNSNLAILFINDATGDTGLQHNGTDTRTLFDGTPTAETGCYLDYTEGSEELSTYTATANSDGTITMSGGTGATGFLILDENGEIIAFSNKYTFELSPEVMQSLMQGTVTITQVSKESEVTESEVDLQAMYKTLLETLINEAQASLELADDGSYSRIGFYVSSAFDGLRAALATAQTAIDNGTGYGAAYDILKSEYDKVLTLGDEYKIPISYSGTFIIKSKRNETMYLNDSQLVSLSSTADESADATRWQFIESDTEGAYYIKSVSGYYLPAVTKSTAMTATQDEASRGKYYVEDLDKGLGLFAIKLSPEGEFTNLHDPSHDPNKVVGWTDNADNSQWYLTKVEHDAAELNTLKLEELIAQTQELANKVYFDAPLQTTNASGDYYLYSNADIADESGDSRLTNLLDDYNDTYMHTVWSGNTADGLNHYLRVYLGEETSLSSFKFEYVTRTNENNEKPKTMTIAGCATKDGEYTTIATLTDLPSASTQTYTSSYYEATGYKYLRFMVDDTYRDLYDGNNHKVYSMAKFSLTIVPAEYASAASLAIAANEKIAAAQAAIEAADESQIETAYEALESAYTALAEAIKSDDDAALEAEKAKLQTLIDETSTLINTVGTANIQGEIDVNLAGKLYAHEPYTAGGTNHDDYSSTEANYNLLDGDDATYFHSNWDSNTISEETYIQVDLGEGGEISDFAFGYTTRNNGSTYPEQIDVYGGNLGSCYVLGNITNTASLNSLTTATRIAIKNISGSNSRYFAIPNNIADYSESVIFIWEPVNEGTAGSYYMRLESQGDNGYIQTGSNGNTLTLGAKSSAQTFHAVEPTTSGSGVNKVNDETFTPTDASDNLVRFAATDNSKWINCAAAANNPYYANTTQFGGYTVHNVYLIENGEDIVYDSEPIATFKSTDASNPLPEKFATWASTDINAGSAYRYYKFKVSNIDNGNWYTVNGIKRHFFVMSEFRFTKTAVYEVTVNDNYTKLVTEDLLAATQTAVNNATGMLTMATTTEQIESQYELLLAQKNSLSDAMNDISTIKAELKTLIDNTTALYNKMAVVTDGTTTVNSAYTYSEVEVATLETTATELGEAQTVYETEGKTPAEVGAAYSELDACYQQLLAWENANTTDRTELNTLLGELGTLLGTMTTTSDTETTVALQTTNQNADYYIWTNAQSSQEGPIANLIDDDAGTHFHSDYSGATPTDGLSNHHLTVNLGYNAISSFKFYYQARSNVANDYPSKILVQGSTNGTDYTDLATVTPLDSDGNTPTNNDEYTSEEINCGGVSYTYLRFMVTETTTARSPYRYFHMAKFDLISTSEVSVNDNYQSPNISIDDVLEALAEKSEKQAMYDGEYLSQTYYNAAIEELQAIVDALTLAQDYASLPVQLTTDTENPILYNILINRSFKTSRKDVISYEGDGDSPSHKVAVEDFVLGDKYQGWYFTPAGEGKVNILPMQGEGKMLSANSYGDGAGKVVATEPATEGYGYEWSIDAIDGSEWYNISILNGETTNYLSNIYGEGNLLGFYNSYNTTDGGSQFKFELADYSKSDAYCTLYNYHIGLTGVSAGNYISQYNNAEGYNTAYSNATTLLEAASSDDDTYTTAYNTLKNAYEALEKNEIVDGSYYVLKSANPSNNNGLAYAGTDNNFYWSASKTTTDASAIWQASKVDGGWNFTNLNTGTKIKAFEYNTLASLTNTHNNVDTDDAPAVITYGELGNGQVRFYANGTWMHSQSDGKIVRWYEGGLNSNSAWYIEPVEVTESTAHNLTISSVGWASLHLNYAVNIPEGVRAFVSAEGVDGDYALLEEIEDGIIPANTGVLLKGAQGNYEFSYTTTENSYDNNLFVGCNHDIYVEAQSTYQYFVLAIGSSGNAALCYILKEVSFDNSGNATLTENSDAGTHFKIPAHKIYLPVAGVTNVKSFGFRVIGGGTGTTDIEGVCGEEGSTESIYDLSGRKLNEITVPGIYIVNGKKVLVNEVK